MASNVENVSIWWRHHGCARSRYQGQGQVITPDKYCGCNYLCLPLKPASGLLLMPAPGTQVLNYAHSLRYIDFCRCLIFVDFTHILQSYFTETVAMNHTVIPLPLKQQWIIWVNDTHELLSLNRLKKLRVFVILNAPYDINEVENMCSGWLGHNKWPIVITCINLSFVSCWINSENDIR